MAGGFWTGPSCSQCCCQGGKKQCLQKSTETPVKGYLESSGDTEVRDSSLAKSKCISSPQLPQLLWNQRKPSAPSPPAARRVLALLPGTQPTLFHLNLLFTGFM